MRVLDVGLLGGPLQPHDGLSRVLRLSEQALEQDHPHLVHGRRIPERGRFLVPLYGLRRVFLGPPDRFVSHLAADGGAIGRLRMPGLGRGLIQAEGLPGLDRQAQPPRAVAVGEVEDGVGIARGDELLDRLQRVQGVTLAVPVARLRIGPAVVAGQGVDRFGQLLREQELCLPVGRVRSDRVLELREFLVRHRCGFTPFGLGQRC